ncbi:MAG TPA: SUMF1/EgtB/PvdO family nonheme iron enzyme [Bacteroidia bacterium]|nr:SUMF1/EgtB/PvdO family nonheme iron enzyme [Bacteroidia bacterium]
MRLANHYIGTFSIPENSHIGIILYDAFEIEIPMLIEFVKTGEDGRIEGRMALKEDAFAFSGTFVDNQIRAVCGTEDDRVRFVWKGSLAEGVLSGTYAGSHEGLRFKLRGIPNGIEGKWSCRACGDGMSDIPLRNQDPFEAQQGNGPDMEKPIAVETSSPSPDIASSLSLSMEGQRAGEARVFGGIEMVWCPPGSFMMGSPPFENGRAAMETPHGVTLTEGFWMATSATTQEQWMGGSPCNPSTFQGMGLPVHNVTWENCHEWLGKMNRENLLSYGWEWSLPTEAQWEYACRAGTGTEV